MTEVTVTRSGMVNTIAYDENTNVMKLAFNSGGTYEYKDVPENVFKDMLAAESAGKYFHSNIKGKYEAEKI